MGACSALLLCNSARGDASESGYSGYSGYREALGAARRSVVREGFNHNLRHGTETQRNLEYARAKIAEPSAQGVASVCREGIAWT